MGNSIDFFAYCWNWVVSLFTQSFTIYGFSISFWELFVFAFLVSCVGWFIGEFLDLGN